MDGPSVEHALRELGPEHQALVELSVVRGISDEEIGGYLGIDPARIAERRGAALHALAAACGDGSEQGVMDVVAILGGDQERAAEDLEKAQDTGEIEALTGIEPLDAEPVEGEVVSADRDEEPATEPPPPLAEVVPAAEEEAPASEPDRPGEKRGGRFLAVIFGGLIVAFVVWMIVAVVGGNDSPSQSSTDDPARQAERPTGALEPLVPGGRARGRAMITTEGGTARLRLTVRNLSPPQDGGGYVAWLYDSVTDTRSLSGDMRGTFTVDSPLPRNYRRYRFIDVSREPADGNRNHSGQSVLRVPLRSVPVR